MNGLSTNQVAEWVANYNLVKCISNFVFRPLYNLKVEGKPAIAGNRPTLLMPAHQTSLDGSSLMNSFEEPLFFVYAYRTGLHIPVISPVFRRILRSMGGIEVRKAYIDLERFFNHLDAQNLIVAFQNGQNPHHVGLSELKPGIVTLVKRYEISHPQTQVSFIPVGIEYKAPKHLPKMLPAPFSHFPPWGTEITVRFGEPEYLVGRTPKELADIVMRESANLSNLSFKS